MASGSGPVWCSLKFWCGRLNPINLQDARPSYMSHISESPHKSFPHFMLVRNKSTTSSPGSVFKPLSSPVAELMLLYLPVQDSLCTICSPGTSSMFFTLLGIPPGDGVDLRQKHHMTLGDNRRHAM